MQEASKDLCLEPETLNSASVQQEVVQLLAGVLTDLELFAILRGSKRRKL